MSSLFPFNSDLPFALIWFLLHPFRKSRMDGPPLYGDCHHCLAVLPCLPVSADQELCPLPNVADHARGTHPCLIGFRASTTKFFTGFKGITPPGGITTCSRS